MTGNRIRNGWKWKLTKTVNRPTCSEKSEKRCTVCVLMVLYPRRRLAAGVVLFSGCTWESACVRACVRAWSYTKSELINRLWDFHHIYNFSAFRDPKAKLVRFFDQEIRDQGHKMVIEALRGIFSPNCGTH